MMDDSIVVFKMFKYSKCRVRPLLGLIVTYNTYTHPEDPMLVCASVSTITTKEPLRWSCGPGRAQAIKYYGTRSIFKKH